jgi:hypothetical protein
MLASDNGQQTSANSTSVVEASDSPLVAGQAALGAKFPDAAAAADGEANATTTTTVRSRLFGFNGTTWDRLRSGLSTISATLTGILNTLPWGLYHAAPVTRTEGQGGPVETDVKGNLRITEQAPPAAENVADACFQVHEKPAASAAFNAIPYDGVAKATAGIIKAAPGNLYRLYVTNDNAAVQAYALVNKASTPATGDTPIMYFYVPAKTTMLLEWKFGKRFSTGIGWAQVTTFGAGTITTTTLDSVANGECS